MNKLNKKQIFASNGIKRMHPPQIFAIKELKIIRISILLSFSLDTIRVSFLEIDKYNSHFYLKQCWASPAFLCSL